MIAFSDIPSSTSHPHARSAISSSSLSRAFTVSAETGWSTERLSSTTRSAISMPRAQSTPG